MRPEFSPALYRAGHGEPLVLVHGFTATWRCWLPVLGFLVPRFEVIAPTLHGHDGGPAPAKPAHSLSEAADHLETMLDDLGVDTAHFAGNSMGGWISLELARRGRARSVVVFSPAGAFGSNLRIAALVKGIGVGMRVMESQGPRLEKLAWTPRGRP